MAETSRGDDRDRCRLGPFRDGRGDRFTERNAPSGRRLVRQVARVLEYRKNRAGLVVEEALDDEGERVRQSLFVRRRLAHVIQLAVRRWIAPRHTPAVRRPGVVRGINGAVSLQYTASAGMLSS